MFGLLLALGLIPILFWVVWKWNNASMEAEKLRVLWRCAEESVTNYRAAIDGSDKKYRELQGRNRELHQQLEEANYPQLRLSAERYEKLMAIFAEWHGQVQDDGK